MTAFASFAINLGVTVWNLIPTTAQIAIRAGCDIINQVAAAADIVKI